VEHSDKITEFAKVAITAFEMKAQHEWLSWGRVHLFSKLAKEVSAELAAVALAKHIEAEEQVR
jgi:hypothetical protein